MLGKRSKQSSQQQPPTDDGSQTAQSGSDPLDSTSEGLERELEEQRAAVQSLREALNAATFKTEILEKSYAKQLAEARDKHAAIESALKEKEEILAGLGGGHEHTLRELSDAVAVIKVLKADRDQLRKQVAQAGFRERGPTKTRAPIRPDADGTINALLANTRVEKRKPGVGTGQATAQVEAEPESPHEEMLSPDLVFTAKDKEKDNER